MAQVDTDAAIRLRVAILSIQNFPRGIRRLADFSNKMLENVQLEPVVCNIVGELLEEYILTTIKNCFDDEPLLQFENALLSGSVSEGTHKINFKEETTSDIDFMLVLKQIQITEADQNQGNLPVKEYTPFLNFYLTDEDLLKTWSQFLETSSDTTCKRTKLSSQKLKDRFRENYIKKVLYTEPPKDKDVHVVEEGPSIAVCSTTFCGEKVKDVQSPLQRFPVYNADFVPAIKCNGWPLCAQEWIFRPRCWPSQDLVQTIVKEGFHIVCKSSPEGDFRLSYSNAETLLIGNLSDLQFKTYRAFKSFVSHYKKNLSPNAKKAVCSYHLKTIVLWYCEKSDPMDWNEGKIVDHLLSLIDDLISKLNDKNLPMYFMPKYNLIEGLDDITQAVKQMTEVRLNLNLITKAIISEEPNSFDALNFVITFFMTFEFAELFPRIEDENCAPRNFRDMFTKSEKPYEKFWKTARGKIDKKDIPAQTNADKIFALIEETIKECCDTSKSDNNEFATFLDTMTTSMATLNKLVKEGGGWRECLYTIYSQSRNAGTHSRQSAVSDPPLADRSYLRENSQLDEH